MPLISQSVWQIGSPFSAYFMTSQPLPQFSVVSAGQLQVQRFASRCLPPRAGALKLLDVSQECLWKLLGAQFDVIIKTHQCWKTLALRHECRSSQAAAPRAGAERIGRSNFTVRRFASLYTEQLGIKSTVLRPQSSKGQDYTQRDARLQKWALSLSHTMFSWNLFGNVLKSGTGAWDLNKHRNAFLSENVEIPHLLFVAFWCTESSS